MKDIRQLTGNKVKILREKAGLTQEKLAELVQVDSGAISNIERGISFPSRILPELCVALHVKIPELFDFENLKYNDEEKKKYIIENVEFLSSQELDIIFRVIKAMK